MERRDFIQVGIAGVGAGLLVPELALAKNESNNMAGGVYYTKQNPGRWAKKIGGHLPNIEIEKSKGKINVQVITAHGMESYEHYIVKHMLLDKDFNFIDEKMFDPLKDKLPQSSYALDNYQGVLYALSMCNKHDVWLSSITI